MISEPDPQAEKSAVTPSPRGEAKRAAILAAAKKVVAEEGFDASLDRIADVAGVSKQTIYSHFGNKEGLMRAMADAKKWEMAGYLDPKLDLEEALTRFGILCLNRTLDPELINLNRMLIGQVMSHPELARTHYECGPGVAMAALAEYFARPEMTARLDIATPDQAAEDFFGLLQGMERQRMLFDMSRTIGPEARATRVAHAVRLFLKAYSPRPA